MTQAKVTDFFIVMNPDDPVDNATMELQHAKDKVAELKAAAEFKIECDSRNARQLLNYELATKKKKSRFEDDDFGDSDSDSHSFCGG